MRARIEPAQFLSEQVFVGAVGYSAVFKQGHRFRAAVEGRISVLVCARGMKRCRAEGVERFKLFVGAAVPNLMIVAALLI